MKVNENGTRLMAGTFISHPYNMLQTEHVEEAPFQWVSMSASALFFTLFRCQPGGRSLSGRRSLLAPDGVCFLLPWRRTATEAGRAAPMVRREALGRGRERSIGIRVAGSGAAVITVADCLDQQRLDERLRGATAIRGFERAAGESARAPRLCRIQRLIRISCRVIEPGVVSSSFFSGHSARLSQWIVWKLNAASSRNTASVILSVIIILQKSSSSIATIVRAASRARMRLSCLRRPQDLRF